MMQKSNKMRAILVAIFIIVVLFAGSFMYLQNMQIRSLQQQISEVSKVAKNNSSTLSDSIVLNNRWTMSDFVEMAYRPMDEAHKRLTDLGFEDICCTEDGVVYLKGPGTVIIKMSKENDIFKFVVEGHESDILKVGDTICHRAICADSLAKAKETPVLMGMTPLDKFVLTYKDGVVTISQMPVSKKKKQAI